MIDRKVDLSTFSRVQKDMVAKNDQALDEFYSTRYVHHLRNYTCEEIEQIINSNSLAEQQALSRNYFDKDGFYKQIILYYATLLTYSGLLIPNPSFGKELSTSQKKKYYAALEYLEGLELSELLTRISLKTLIYGSYYGVIKVLNKDECVIFDLPIDYSRSRFTDIHGNDIVEFDVSYFNTIIDESNRKEILDTYPSIISSYYNKFKKGKVSTSWLTLPAEIGICFTFFDDGRPMFLNIIPASIQYDESVDTERERQLDEIRKILVQKIPHLTTGELLFEPEEALEMHKGAVNMMKGNKNLSVLTTYADVDAIISKTAADNSSTSLEKMLQNVYANGGVSEQIFSPTGTQALPISIKNDISLMMILGNKYSRFITYILNSVFANGTLKFKYLILSISEYTKSDFITDALKLAQSGFSYLLPALGLGLNQLELVNIKNLENDTLKLKEMLIPLSSSYTETSGKVGRPAKNLEEKSQKTIQNEEALDHQGGSNE